MRQLEKPFTYVPPPAGKRGSSRLERARNRDAVKRAQLQDQANFESRVHTVLDGGLKGTDKLTGNMESSVY